MANNLESVKKDITYILQLNNQIQYHNKNNVKKALNTALEKKLFKTALGQRYITRLEQIVNGTENSYTCVLCGRDLDNSTLVCVKCLEKYKMMTPEQAATARKARLAKKAEEAKKAVDAEPRGAAAIFREIEEKGLSFSRETAAAETDSALPIQTEKNPEPTKENTKPDVSAKSGNSKFMNFFTGLFKEHTNEDANEIFIAGTARTTPPEYELTDTSPKPWLFLRIFTALALTFGFLYICAAQLQNFNTIPALLFLGAAVFPFSILTLMYECNTPKNISFFDVIKMFFAGSIAALLLTTVTFNVFPVGQLDYGGAVIVGFIEELAKLVVIIIFIRLVNPKYILNGLLIGAAVGAGFSVFESAGYAFRFYLLSGGNIGYLTDIILLRVWSSLGSHTVWSAIAGGGLLAAKNDKPLSFKLFYDSRFLSNFIVSLLFHSVWNCPFMDNGSGVYIKLIVLIVLAWGILLSLIKSGTRQFKYICYIAHNNQKGAGICQE